ncbi:MAG TPA: hypothetical protein VE291_12490 [Terracidiphilus sp.]|jgi:hypothetical protein|nr:hypothetical protein [Terracidiphilus sp.]
MRVFWYAVLLSLCPLHGALAQSCPTGLPILQDDHIFVLTAVAVSASPWKDDNSSQIDARTLNVQFRLDKNIRGDLDFKEGATTFVALKQARFGSGVIWDNPEFWSYYDLTAGQSWMIGTDGHANDLQTLLQHPKSVEQVSGTEAVQDVELMIQNCNLSAAEQGDKLAEWLEQTKEPRGSHIGEYAAELLAGLASPGNTKLEQMAKDGTLEKRLTEDGQYAFLVALYQASRSSVSPQDSTVQVLTGDTIDFLFTSGHNPASKMQRDIIQNYLPWLVSLPQAKPIMRETMNDARRKQVVTQLQLLSSGSSLSSTDRETLARLSELLSK